MRASRYLNRRFAAVVALALACAACRDKSAGTKRVTPAPGDLLPRERPAGTVEVTAMFYGAMPTGVTVSRNDRVLVSFPRVGDPVEYTLAELRDGQLVPFPDAELNQWPGNLPADQALVSVQSVVTGPTGRIWAVDTGNPKFEGVIPGAAKLVALDPVDGTVLERISLPPSVALRTSYLSDARIDLRRGKAGVAFITDASMRGPNAIIVVDLASGRSWRRLDGHPSTKADPAFVPFVEARELWVRRPGKPRERYAVGADGIALSPDGKRLYYCPLASRRLYAVSVDALVNELLPDSEVAKTVEDLGEKGASNGLESDEQGRIYVSSYEHNAIMRRDADGTFETLVHDPRVLWPDTLHLATDGWLYFTVNQLNRQPRFHDGHDERVRPYALMRVKTDGRPVRLANVPVL
ncbi:MAG: SMP-30/gluconolactonase/LRE family protein [Labilithrix sp.]|nr:SMP-30/gluconolactonase/LRE family protein [Labilithrix sp.]